MTPKAKKYLRLIRTEPYKIGHWLGFTDLTELHNKWLKDFLFNPRDQTLLAHRGSYKTTTLSIALALLIIIKPKQNTIFLRKTDSDVVEIIKQVSKMLQSEVLNSIIKEVHGVNLSFRVNSFTEIDTNLNNSSRGTSQLVGMGISTSITGKHSDIVVTDDIVNLKDRASRAERERTKQAYMELQNIKNRGGRFINTGTPWHKEDAISIMPNVEKYDCYSTNLISKDQIRELQSVMTPSLFAANYELQHIANEDAMFENPQYTNDYTKLYNGLGHIDAGYGGGDGSIYTAANQVDGKVYVFGKRWEKHIEDCLEEIEHYHKEYRTGTIHNELNADKGYLINNLRKRGLPAQAYHERENKYIKIATFLRKRWKDIIFVEGTDPEYVREILDYTEHAEHDDAPDSLASVIRIYDKYTDFSDDKETINAFKKLGL